MTADELATNAFKDMHDNENSWEVYIKAMKEYARLQIEKDRERVIGEIENDNETNDLFLVIRTTQIILD